METSIQRLIVSEGDYLQVDDISISLQTEARKMKHENIAYVPHLFKISWATAMDIASNTTLTGDSTKYPQSIPG